MALVALRVDFPGHSIWRANRSDGRPGDWVATLRDPSQGVDPTVIASDADRLRELLIIERGLALGSRDGL
ncbi:hypothetical protein AB0J52_11560 [Spirillospora sp. NPDC049652]